MIKEKNKQLVFVGVPPKERILPTGQAGGDKPLVFVGVSGGVDSSVSLALLKDAGYDVVGVFIRTWTPNFIECTWRDERRDAMRVCAHLDVPFLECDAEEAYKKGVADYMIDEYKKGNVPNPDVMCNREVKFGIFWQFAKERGADFIATGHYVQNMYNFSEKYLSKPTRSLLRRPRLVLDASLSREVLLTTPSFAPAEAMKDNFLMRSPDPSKDQSYFLWTLTQEDLAHTLFPIGYLHKTEVRKLAEKYKLPTATKKDSQGVCFLGPLDMKDFLKHYIESKSGDVVDTNGKVIGNHDGAIFFTLGERHGFNITEKGTTDEPYYVVAKNIEKNILIVSHNKNEYQKNNNEIELEKVVTRGELGIGKKYTAQIRYHGENLPIIIVSHTKDKLTIKFEKSDPTASSGQSVVIYDGDICLAGGVIV
ncbi:tRNA-specific 2-thiouridylase [Candidatus Nomurabacteria bacterium]|nr:tRNA-specific 2-thiouridylase [Candidatus Nomurabacteria bacterium]